MLSFGALSFAFPWALLALVALPALWWLLRLTPPAPFKMRFPPIALLLQLRSQEESSAKSPLWLLLLRLALAIAIIFAVSQPLWDAGSNLRGAGPVVVVVDDGWAGSRHWAGRKAALADIIGQAERQDRSVVLVTTAPDGAARGPASVLVAAEARRIAEALEPKPWSVNRVAALDRLTETTNLMSAPPGHVFWLSDGLDHGGTAAFIQGLRRFGTVTVVDDPIDMLPMVLRPPVAEGQGLNVHVARAGTSLGGVTVLRGLDDNGQPIHRQTVNFQAGEAEARATIEVPSELRNRLARLELENESTAAGVVLLDERWRRRPVGLVSAEGVIGDQPLLSELFYLERALEPFTEIRRGSVKDLLARRIAVLVLADPGPLDANDLGLVQRWIADGGIAVRFAGPRLATEADELLPVQLRLGDRILGGSMSWSRPASLAPFRDASPFHGLAISGDAKVRRQVLAQPALDLLEKTWAELSDGTPLVTAARRERGWLVLVHTTANTSWSDLPLTGTFVGMLQRIVGLSQGVAARPGNTPLPPVQTVDGYGRLGPPPSTALALTGAAIDAQVPGPEHPPGYYGEDTARRAFNLSASVADPKPIGAIAGVERETYERAAEADLTPWLYLVALMLAVVDLLASLALRGHLRVRRGPVAAMLAVGLFAATPAFAQTGDAFAMAASLKTRLAYVVTGDIDADETSRAGLAGASVVVNQRTAAELAEPVGISLETDELPFFPLLYWPITGSQSTLSANAVAKLNTFMRNGGLVFFDTRSQGGAGRPDVLRSLARTLDIPPIAPIPADHVLTRSYYLLREFPGRWAGGTLWVERPGERINDGVSSILVGHNDWAGAWAMDDAQRPMNAVVPGGDRQRELAYRFAINLVMYTLTGNYKSDQVHLPSILQRLGQ